MVDKQAMLEDDEYADDEDDGSGTGGRTLTSAASSTAAAPSAVPAAEKGKTGKIDVNAAMATVRTLFVYSDDLT